MMKEMVQLRFAIISPEWKRVLLSTQGSHSLVSSLWVAGGGEKYLVLDPCMDRFDRMIQAEIRFLSQLYADIIPVGKASSCVFSYQVWMEEQ